MMANKLIVTFGLLLLPISLIHADELDIADAQIADNYTLSTLRGGFRLSNDYVIDIGISITAAVNGKNIYQTTIANLVFRNGALTAKPTSSHDSDLPSPPNKVSVVQVGDGNFIDGVEGAGSETDPVEPPPPVAVTGPSIINIIQNTLDDSVIGLNTVVDVDARVESVNKQIRDDLRLKESLLQHRY